MCSRQFTVIDESFECAHCHQNVPQHPDGSCRNHCPFCLHSTHLDILPGDRQAGCGGLMRPVKAELSRVDKVRLHHRCLQCDHISRNKTASDDDLEIILSLMRRSDMR